MGFYYSSGYYYPKGFYYCLDIITQSDFITLEDFITQWDFITFVVFWLFVDACVVARPPVPSKNCLTSRLLSLRSESATTRKERHEATSDRTRAASSIFVMMGEYFVNLNSWLSTSRLYFLRRESSMMSLPADERVAP
jgi:hypothetical protein